MSSEEVPTPKRQGTMQATAEEGVEFLKRNAADDLVAAQGLDANENGNAKNGHDATPVKTQTMEETTKEGEAFVGDDVDPDVKTRSEQAKLDAIEAETPTPVKTATMEATTKEGEAFVGDDVDPDVKTRSEQAKLDEIEAETPVPVMTHTMEETIKEGEAFVNGDKEFADKKHKLDDAAADDESSEAKKAKN